MDAFLLWKLLQTEGSSPVGLALWMSWKLGMQAREIVALTWSQVDLDRGVIHLPDRDLTLGITLRRLLRTAQNRRREGDDPHVGTTPMCCWPPIPGGPSISPGCPSWCGRR